MAFPVNMHALENAKITEQKKHIRGPEAIRCSDPRVNEFQVAVCARLEGKKQYTGEKGIEAPWDLIPGPLGREHAR